MPETEYSPALARKKTAIASFLASLVTSAKTAGLYKAGHPTLLQIAERTVGLLQKTLAQETNLTLDVKAKTVAIEESDFSETPEIVVFAGALHTLGVGQILFTNRITREGMYEFFRILTAKPDEKTSLSDLQKAVQQTKIDGLQMVFILSFVVTGETEQASQPPGQLSEEQIQAFLKAETLPDFLTLLLRQNEALHGKEAEAVSGLLDAVLYRETTLEKFTVEMPWSAYDKRLRARCDELRGLPYRPQIPGRRAGWRRCALVSWAAVLEEADRAVLSSHETHSEKDALRFCLEHLHTLMDAPIGKSQLKYVLFAYTRLLISMGLFSDVAGLLKEYERWPAMEPSARRLLEAELLGKLLSASLVGQLSSYLNLIAEGSEDYSKITEFAHFFGPGIVPLLIDELHNVQDKSHRKKLGALLTILAKRLGDDAIIKALLDEDWLVVVTMVAVLTELCATNRSKPVAGLLKHGHQKVRESAVRFLGKFGDETAVKSLGEFAAEARHPEEVGKAVITLSLLNQPGVDSQLVAAFRKTKSHDSRVAIAMALGRHPSNAGVALLKETARRSWYEILTGRNKDLQEAARHSLELLRKEGRA